MGDALDLRAVRNEPDEDVVKTCERMLRCAKEGRLRSLVWLAVFDDHIESGNAGRRHDRYSCVGHLMGAALDYYMRRRDDESVITDLPED